MNRITLNNDTLAVAFDNKKGLMTPIFSNIIVLILSITTIWFYHIFVNGEGLADTAPNSTVYLIQDDEYVETSPSHGRPDLSESFAITNQAQPSFALWHPYAQHDLWRLVYFGTDKDGRHQQHDVDLTITPLDKGMVIAEPTESLQAGSYCFYERDWFNRPAPTAHHCFQVEG